MELEEQAVRCSCGRRESGLDEAAVIRAAQNGSVEAFNELVLAYQQAVYTQVCWVVKDPAAAEDLTQEAFIQAYRSLSQYRGGSFRSWLMRIALNRSLDRLRWQKRHPTLPLEPPDDDGEGLDSAEWLAGDEPSVEDQVEQAEQARLAARAVAALPEEFRSALVLVELQGFDYEEAAAALSIPVGTLKSRLSRARLRLREAVLSQASLPAAGTLVRS